MTIRWTTALETGHRQIDLQHQELVELLDELATAHRAGRDDDALHDILPRLASYVLFHFGTEEMLMAGLPASNAHAVAHRQAHREFTARVETLRAQTAAGEHPSLGPLVDYLQAWLLEHIMNTDRELVVLIAGHPAGRPPI
ncbi:MAG TPA: bacteriohemerythrin [Azonexus sp.]